MVQLRRPRRRLHAEGDKLYEEGEKLHGELHEEGDKKDNIEKLQIEQDDIVEQAPLDESSGVPRPWIKGESPALEYMSREFIEIAPRMVVSPKAIDWNQPEGISVEKVLTLHFHG